MKSTRIQAGKAEYEAHRGDVDPGVGSGGRRGVGGRGGGGGGGGGGAEEELVDLLGPELEAGLDVLGVLVEGLEHVLLLDRVLAEAEVDLDVGALGAAGGRGVGGL